MAFVGIVGYTPVSGGLVHSIVTRVLYILIFILMLMCPWFPCWKGPHIFVYEMHHFVDALVVRISFDHGEHLGVELGRDLINCIWILCKSSCLSARCGINLI